MEIKKLDYETCYEAHRGTSFSPEVRAKQEQENYIKGFQDLLRQIIKLDPNRAEEIEIDVLDFESKYRKKKIEILSTRGRIISPVISGPANFPTTRQEKANNSYNNKSNGIVEYWENGEKRLEKKYRIKKAFNINSDIEAISQGIYDKTLIKGAIERKILREAKISIEKAMEMKEFCEAEKMYKLFTKRHGIRKKIDKVIENHNSEIEKFEGW